jgi:hypothetical protein
MRSFVAGLDPATYASRSNAVPVSVDARPKAGHERPKEQA